MKHFACGDVVPGCAATFAAGSVDDVLAAVARHAGTAHGLVEVPDGLVADVVANIRDAADA